MALLIFQSLYKFFTCLIASVFELFVFLVEYTLTDVTMILSRDVLFLPNQFGSTLKRIQLDLCTQLFSLKIAN